MAQAKWAFWQLIVSVIGIAFVVATLIYTAITAKAAQKAAEIAEKTLVADKRAFVFASGISHFYEIQPSGEYHWRIRPMWQNTGDTPTRRLQLFSDGALRSAPLPLGFAISEVSSLKGTGMLGPQSSSMGGLVPSPLSPALTVQDIEDIIAGRKFFYMWGGVRYFDVFPDSGEHVTRFCWQITCSGDPRTFTPERQTLQFGYLHHSEGNCADEECGA